MVKTEPYRNFIRLRDSIVEQSLVVNSLDSNLLVLLQEKQAKNIGFLYLCRGKSNLEASDAIMYFLTVN